MAAMRTKGGFTIHISATARTDAHVFESAFPQYFSRSGKYNQRGKKTIHKSRTPVAQVSALPGVLPLFLAS
jgi:hypothetical protein